MPRHPRTLQTRQRCIASILIDVLEIHNPSIVVVLPGEKGVCELRGVYVGKRVRVGVPAAKAEVEPANAGEVLVDYDDFFVVGPEFDTI
jgi:hypothetical protein